MVKIAGYRNILVHGYLEVERGETYKNINHNLFDLVEFGRQIEKFLDSKKVEPSGKLIDFDII